MNVQNYVRGAAELARIVELHRGDCYKRMKETHSSDEMVYGIVTDVMDNGEKTALQTMEFATSYGTMTTTFETFGGGRDVALFPAEPSELNTYLADVEERQERSVETAQNKVNAEKLTLEGIRNIKNGDLIAQLRRASVSHVLPEPEPELPAEQEPEVEAAFRDEEPF